MLDAEVQQAIRADDRDVTEGIGVEHVAGRQRRHLARVHRHIREHEDAILVGHPLGLNMRGDQMAHAGALLQLIHFYRGIGERLTRARDKAHPHLRWDAVKILAVVTVRLILPEAHGQRAVRGEEGAASAHQTIGRRVTQAAHLILLRTEVHLIQINQAQLMSHLVEVTIINVFLRAVVAGVAIAGGRLPSVETEGKDGELDVVHRRIGRGIGQQFQPVVMHPLRAAGRGEHGIEARHVPLDPVNQVIRGRVWIIGALQHETVVIRLVHEAQEPHRLAVNGHRVIGGPRVGTRQGKTDFVHGAVPRAHQREREDPVRRQRTGVAVGLNRDAVPLPDPRDGVCPRISAAVANGGGIGHGIVDGRPTRHVGRLALPQTGRGAENVGTEAGRLRDFIDRVFRRITGKARGARDADHLQIRLIHGPVAANGLDGRRPRACGRNAGDEVVIDLPVHQRGIEVICRQPISNRHHRRQAVEGSERGVGAINGVVRKKSRRIGYRLPVQLDCGVQRASGLAGRGGKRDARLGVQVEGVEKVLHLEPRRFAIAVALRPKEAGGQVEQSVRRQRGRTEGCSTSGHFQRVQECGVRAVIAQREIGAAFVVADDQHAVGGDDRCGHGVFPAFAAGGVGPFHGAIGRVDGVKLPETIRVHGLEIISLPVMREAAAALGAFGMINSCGVSVDGHGQLTPERRALQIHADNPDATIADGQINPPGNRVHRGIAIGESTKVHVP